LLACEDKLAAALEGVTTALASDGSSAYHRLARLLCEHRAESLVAVHSTDGQVDILAEYKLLAQGSHTILEIQQALLSLVQQIVLPEELPGFMARVGPISFHPEEAGPETEPASRLSPGSAVQTQAPTNWDVECMPAAMDCSGSMRNFAALVRVDDCGIADLATSGSILEMDALSQEVDVALPTLGLDGSSGVWL